MTFLLEWSLKCHIEIYFKYNYMKFKGEICGIIFASFQYILKLGGSSHE